MISHTIYLLYTFYTFIESLQYFWIPSILQLTYQWDFGKLSESYLFHKHSKMSRKFKIRATCGKSKKKYVFPCISALFPFQPTILSSKLLRKEVNQLPECPNTLIQESQHANLDIQCVLCSVLWYHSYVIPADIKDRVMC